MSEETRNYEAVIVFNVHGEEGIDALVKAVGKEMEEEGVKLDKIDKIGKQKFAYNARKQSGGYYVNYAFKAAPSAVIKVRDRLRINTDIYMQHFQKV